MMLPISIQLQFQTSQLSRWSGLSKGLSNTLALPSITVKFRLHWGGIRNSLSLGGPVRDESSLNLIVVLVGIEFPELLKRSIRSFNKIKSLNRGVVWTGDETGIDWVDELGCLGSVIEARKVGNIECGHHGVIFVDQVVAMEHIESFPRTVPCKLQHLEIPFGVIQLGNQQDERE